MTNDEIRAENESLRQQLELYRQRELVDLRQQLAEAKEAADHFRKEAQRNADIGRQVASEYQQQVTELRSKLSTLEQVNTSVRRFATTN